MFCFHFILFGFKTQFLRVRVRFPPGVQSSTEMLGFFVFKVYCNNLLNNYFEGANPIKYFEDNWIDRL